MQCVVCMGREDALAGAQLLCEVLVGRWAIALFWSLLCWNAHWPAPSETAGFGDHWIRGGTEGGFWGRISGMKMMAIVLGVVVMGAVARGDTRGDFLRMIERPRGELNAVVREVGAKDAGGEDVSFSV